MLLNSCQALLQSTANGDYDAAEDSFDQVMAHIDGASAAEMSVAVRAFAPVLAKLPLNVGHHLLIPAVMMIQLGAEPPADLVEMLAFRVADGLERAARFPSLWKTAATVGDMPSYRDSERIAEAAQLLEVAADACGYTAAQVLMIVEGWFVAHEWAGPLLNLLQRKDVRQHLPHRERLTAAATAIAENYRIAAELVRMLMVLDDQQLIVLHPDSRKGFRLTISGIGDNCQLNTLLAANLIGDPSRGFVSGLPPEPAWVAAATIGNPRPGEMINARFHMLDAGEIPVLHEGIPADIPVVHGQRVLVLRNVIAFGQAWQVGRPAPHMQPAMTIEGHLTAAEVGHWLGRSAAV